MGRTWHRKETPEHPSLDPDAERGKERRAATPLERTLLTLLLGVLAGLAPPAWTMAQRVAKLEVSILALTNAQASTARAVERIEDRVNALPNTLAVSPSRR